MPKRAAKEFECRMLPFEPVPPVPSTSYCLPLHDRMMLFRVVSAFNMGISTRNVTRALEQTNLNAESTCKLYKTSRSLSICSIRTDTQHQDTAPAEDEKYSCCTLDFS